jgi:tRNA threonylcarbamoyladenosine biosynthesis protein TsaB
MVLILAFDTTSEFGGAGLFRDEVPLGEVPNTARRGGHAAAAGGPERASYSVTLFEMVEKLLASNRLSLRDVELFAVANGPGSFTGIRVGVAAAQGWAMALGRPVLGVSVLEAMVEAAMPETEFAAALFDARRGEFFFGAFHIVARGRAKHFVPAGEGRALPPEDIPNRLEVEFPDLAQVTLVARESDPAAFGLRASLPKGTAWRMVPGTLVSAIARLGLEAARRGELQSPADLDAYYIRRSDAELNWRS